MVNSAPFVQKKTNLAHFKNFSPELILGNDEIVQHMVSIERGQS